MRHLLLSCLLYLSLPAFAQEPLLHQGIEVHAGSIQKEANALLYADDLKEYQDILLINPGGLIPAAAMSGLATAFARQGSIVYVLKNPGDLAINAPTLAADFAAGLKFSDTPLARNDLELRVLGHSLGGAVLGAEIGNAQSYFKEIILIGVSKLAGTPQKAAVKVLSMLLGEKDGLASKAGVDQLAKVFGTETRVIPGVNHFCIISDPSVGAPDKKAQDLPTDLTSDECAARVVQALDH